MNQYLRQLAKAFEAASNPELAIRQQAYMRNQFAFHGITSPQRKEIQKPFLHKQNLPASSALHDVVESLWQKEEREYQYFAQELTNRYERQQKQDDIGLYEFMITNKSWWDTVDFIAANLVGRYFRHFPEARAQITKKWMASDNIWLQRTTLLFQLKYKDGIDSDFLADTIRLLLGSKEFFINKAIGWILREYSKTHPVWVEDFANQTPLHPLSRREALRLIK